MIDIAFVILNYNVYEETKTCIDAIIDCIDTDNYQIVIVDNGSNVFVREMLENNCEEYSNVHLILNENNEGFARGNNIGIDYVRRQWGGARFICCLNNDVIISQHNVFKLLCYIYESNRKIAVIGPRIFDRYYCEYDESVELSTKQQYLWTMIALKEQKKIRDINSKVQWKQRLLENDIIYDINHFRRNVQKNMQKRINSRRNARAFQGCIERNECLDGINLSGKNNLILHGCCLFFTPSFFEELDGFDQSTFLYVEEPILYVDIVRNGMFTFKSDNIIVRHLEDVSTDATFNSKEKKAFIAKHTADSLKVLIDKMEKYGFE